MGSGLVNAWRRLEDFDFWVTHIQRCEAVIGTIQSSFQWYCFEAVPGRPSILDSTRLKVEDQFGQQIFGCVYDVCPYLS